MLFNAKLRNAAFHGTGWLGTPAHYAHLVYQTMEQDPTLTPPSLIDVTVAGIVNITIASNDLLDLSIAYEHLVKHYPYDQLPANIHVEFHAQAATKLLDDKAPPPAWIPNPVTGAELHAALDKVLGAKQQG